MRETLFHPVMGNRFFATVVDGLTFAVNVVTADIAFNRCPCHDLPGNQREVFTANITFL